MNKRSVIHTNTHLGRRLIFLPFYSYTIWRNPYTFRQNPIQFGETTGFRQIVSNFRHIPIFQQHLQTKYCIFLLKTAISYSFLHTIPETPDFCRKVYFCQIVSIATLTAVSKIQKKRGSPVTPVNPSKPENP